MRKRLWKKAKARDRMAKRGKKREEGPKMPTKMEQEEYVGTHCPYMR